MAQLTPESSTLVADVLYSYSTNQLEVTLLNGATYRYYKVPDTKWRALLKATSPGSYLSRNVMRGQFRKRKLS